MKEVLIFLIIMTGCRTYGQIENPKLNVDTRIKVSHIYPDKEEREPAYFLNKRLVNSLVLTTINPEIIESINVIKQNKEIQGKKYFGQIHIKTKDNYPLKLISLNDLKLKYTDLNSNPALFFINNQIVHDNYDEFLVDEHYILRIIIEEVNHKEEKLKINTIRLLTKSKENIEKSKEIRIRGNSDMAVKR